jgi:spore coat polysaccharide biosynthesis protein SpsF
MGSTRLAGKVLADLGGRPLLSFMLNRLTSLPVDHLVVATSAERQDDAIAEVVAKSNVPVVRGPEHDVLQRFVLALDAYPADIVVRLTADCPLVDVAIVRDAIDLVHAENVDYASNTLVRTFPDGLDVEALTAPALRAAAAHASAPEEREHVTPWIYRRPNSFRLASVRTADDLGDERWTVDTADDLERLRDIVCRLPNAEHAGWREVLDIAGVSRVTAHTHLRPDPQSQPAVRRWRVIRDGRDAGSLAVTVADGGEARLSLGSEVVEPDERIRLLQRQLRRDFQVRSLWVPVAELVLGARDMFESAEFVAAERDGEEVLRWHR